MLSGPFDQAFATTATYLLTILFLARAFLGHTPSIYADTGSEQAA